jgi:hypothetical protein
MIRAFLLSLATLATLALAPAAQAEEMIDLPVNHDTTALTYLYCLTGDDKAVSDLLRQRLEFAGVERPSANQTARKWVGEGYCREFLARSVEVAPQLREQVTAKLIEDGFTLNRPITEQVDDGATTSKSVFKKIFKGIGRLIKTIFGGGGFGAGGNGSYNETTVTNADGSSTTTKTCDRSWYVGTGGGGKDFGPTPYFPEPGQN